MVANSGTCEGDGKSRFDCLKTVILRVQIKK